MSVQMQKNAQKMLGSVNDYVTYLALAGLRSGPRVHKTFSSSAP